MTSTYFEIYNAKKCYNLLLQLITLVNYATELNVQLMRKLLVCKLMLIEGMIYKAELTMGHIHPSVDP